MFVEKFHTPGLAHLSYLVGAGDTAAVIDPQRDTSLYLRAAAARGVRIAEIFETHRNEDFVIGSRDLAAATGAPIRHGAALAFGYGTPVHEGDRFALGDCELAVLETPGHTDESISLALYDRQFSADEPVGVFTGDALFIGNVGRTDFYPERAEQVAGALYDSLFEKLLPLGDQAVVYPAHGAGSVCGSNIAEREFSTLGFERRHNPMLHHSRPAFIEAKTAEHHYQPPYFGLVHRLNQEGPPLLRSLPQPQPMTADEFAEAMDGGMFAVDLRSPEAACGALIPDSLVIPHDMLAAFAGWLLPAEAHIGFITDAPGTIDDAVRQLLRLGFENVVGYLDDGLHGWEVSGRDYQVLTPVHAKTLARRLERGDGFTLLDVRGRDEVEAESLPGATTIYVGELPQQLDRLPKARPVTTFCGSGKRAVIAAALLKQAGFEDVEVCLGSMAACRAVGCPIQ